MSCVRGKCNVGTVHADAKLGLNGSRSEELENSVAVDRKETIVVRSKRVAPDGGYGWLVSFVTFVVTFLLTGFLKSFSVWRAAVMVEFPETTTAEASWISGRIGTLSLMCSPLVSGLLTRFGNGAIVAVGSIFCALGFLISYFATSAGYLIGSLGVCVGVGSSFAITASLSCTDKFFTRRKPTAMSIALSGGCVGAIVMPYILRALFIALGLHCTFLVLAGIFFILSLSGFVYANPESHFDLVEEEKVLLFQEVLETGSVSEETSWQRIRSKVTEMLALRYLRRPLFITMAFSVFALNMGSPHFLGQISGQAERIEANSDSMYLLTLLLQLADLTARLFYGMLAPKYPFRRTTEYTFALGTCALCSLLAIFCTAFWMLAVLTFVGSFAVGVINISIPLVLSYNHGVENMSNTLNLARCFQGLSVVIYRLVSPTVQTTKGIPGLLIFNASHLWASAILGLVVCFLPREK